jgi:hypothetical protein
MYYAQSKKDNELLQQFNDVINKYNFKLREGLIVKKANATYPRLVNTQLRGKRSAVEVLKSLTQGIIDDAPFSMIYDIMKTQKLYCDNGYIASPHVLTFVNLSLEKPQWDDEAIMIKKLLQKNHNNKIGLIKRILEKCNFTLEDINEVNNYLMRLGPAFTMSSYNIKHI